MKSSSLFVASLVGITSLTLSTAWAQPAKKDEKTTQPATPPKKADQPAKPATPAKPETGKPADKGAPPGMDPAAMAAYEAAAKPNENHKALEAMVGEWESKTTFWMAPGAPAMEGSGTMKSEMVFGGRQLHSMFKGNFTGQPFEGGGTTGYNNVTKQYESTWCDTMGTGTMFSTGTADKDHKVFTITGSYDDPMQGKVTMRQVITLADKDHYKMEFFSKGTDGKEFKSGEITYARKRSANPAEAPKADAPKKEPAKTPEKK